MSVFRLNRGRAINRMGTEDPALLSQITLPVVTHHSLLFIDGNMVSKQCPIKNFLSGGDAVQSSSAGIAHALRIY